MVIFGFSDPKNIKIHINIRFQRPKNHRNTHTSGKCSYQVMVFSLFWGVVWGSQEGSGMVRIGWNRLSSSVDTTGIFYQIFLSKSNLGRKPALSTLPLSHRICNIWRCQQTTARNLTELVDILCQQIGDRNQTDPVRIWWQTGSKNRAGSALSLNILKI